MALLCALLLLVQGFAAPIAQAQDATGGPFPVNLDLSSTQRSSTASSSAFASHPVVIQTAGGTRSVSTNDLLTPSEMLAVQQVLLTGQQSIQLAAQGNAIGGNFSLNAINEALSSLVIPQGVTSFHDFGSK